MCTFLVVVYVYVCDATTLEIFTTTRAGEICSSINSFFFLFTFFMGLDCTNNVLGKQCAHL